MCVLHISEEECGPAMLEAALIEKFKGIVAAPTALLYHTACFALLTALKSLRRAWLQKHKIRRRQCEGAHGRLSVGVYDIHRVQKLQA